MYIAKVHYFFDSADYKPLFCVKNMIIKCNVMSYKL